MSDEQAFLAAIAASPDDVSRRLVFADWLDEHGNQERAEFIRVQCRLAELPKFDPARAALEDREHALLAQHEAAWVGSLAKLVTKWTFRRGCVEAVDTGARKFLTNAKKIFALAPVQDVRLSRMGAHICAEIADCPYLSKVRRLELQGEMVFADMQALGAGNHLQGLKSLVMPGSSRMDPLNPIAETPLTDLRELEIHGGYAGDWWASNLLLPALQKLSLSAVNFLVTVGLAEWPAMSGLTHLNLSHNNIRVPGAQAIAVSSVLTNLVDLNLHDCSIGVNGARAIGASDTLANLQCLDVRGNHFGTSGLRALLEGGKQQHLVELYLGMNDLDAAAVDLLATWPGLARLRVLHLYSNPEIGDQAVARLAGLASLSRLHELDLAFTGIGQAGALALARNVHLSGLLRLNLGGNPALGDGGVSLLACSPYLANLRELDLRGTSLGDTGARAILDSPFLTKLRRLELRANNIRAPLQQALQARFGKGVIID